MGAVRSKRFVAIDNCQYSSAERYFLALQPARVSLAIPLFVMMFDYRNNLIGKLDVAQNIGADHRVNHHFGVLRRAELAGFAQDVFGDREFSNIVEKRRRLQSLHLVFRIADRAPKSFDQRAHSLNMTARQIVFGIDCHRKRFDRCLVKPGQPFDMLVRRLNSPKKTPVSHIGKEQNGK